tara:strand:- start:740 stop:880 length:141 start_codon:yes stop_codon:yes gene_type:complete
MNDKNIEKIRYDRRAKKILALQNHALPNNLAAYLQGQPLSTFFFGK